MLTHAERYRDTMDHLPITAESPRGFVSATRDEKGEVTVRLRRGVLGRLTEQELATEIRDGLGAALTQYASRGRELRRQYLVASAELLDPEPGPASAAGNKGIHRGWSDRVGARHCGQCSGTLRGFDHLRCRAQLHRHGRRHPGQCVGRDALDRQVARRCSVGGRDRGRLARHAAVAR